MTKAECVLLTHGRAERQGILGWVKGYAAKWNDLNKLLLNT